MPNKTPPVPFARGDSASAGHATPLQPVRVKFCGITSVSDAQAAAQAGCDAIGLVFVPSSPRCITPRQAADICQALSPWITVIGLFADASAKEVASTLESVPLHGLQFHGKETPEFCRQWQRPWIKAVPMRDGVDPVAYVRDYPDASGWLLDCYGTWQSGGSGKSFDWSLFPADNDPRWILAGGLEPENITAALQATAARNVDVSSGIEQAPGIKSTKKMQQFMQQIRLI
jgi:phosphoribosylanthranilate isomerase